MIVCADDYGLREDIDRAILELVESGRLSAVSCLVALERCTPAALAKLTAYGPRIDVGLHFCLTDEGLPLSPSSRRTKAENGLPRYSTLLRRSLLGRVSAEQTLNELSSQYELFVQKIGRRPDYIDGHLHVHQLPGVRKGLLAFLAGLALGSRPYVRNTFLPLRELRQRGLPWLKPATIGVFGRRMFLQLRAAGIPTNRGFAGVYDFGQWRRFGDYFPKFASCLPQANGLLVVHPGYDESWRQQEFRVLSQVRLPAGALNRFQRGPGA